MTAARVLELPLTAPAKRQVKLEQVRAFLASEGSASDRVKFLQNEIFVHTADVIYVINTIETLLERALTVASPGGLRLVAGGGMGKDALLQYFIKKYPPESVGSTFTCPIIHATLGPRVAPVDVIRQFLVQLKCAFKKSWTLTELEEHLFAAMDACETRGIFINEAGHLVPVGTRARHISRLAGLGGDWLKGFIDRNRRPFVLMGVVGWDGAFEQDPQLRTRIPHRYEIREFALDATFIGVLRALDVAIPMRDPAGLDQMPRAQQLHVASRGNWRLLSNLLADAITHASQRGSPKIEDCDLHAAYRLRLGTTNNPFSGAT